MASVREKGGDEPQVDELQDALARERQRAELLQMALDERNAQIAKLGDGDADPLLRIKRLEQELALVSHERNALRAELNRVEGMQTETVTLSDADETGESLIAYRASADPDLPSIDELMAALQTGQDGQPRRRAAPESSPSSSDTNTLTGEREGEDEDEGEWREMIPPELMVAGSPSEKQKGPFPGRTRWRMVRIDVDPPQEFSLDEPLMTIGRSDSADIAVDGDFISRIHARLLLIQASILIEDAGSKNGTAVNGELVKRWPLSHGDTVSIGSVQFRFCDDAA